MSIICDFFLSQSKKEGNFIYTSKGYFKSNSVNVLLRVFFFLQNFYNIFMSYAKTISREIFGNESIAKLKPAKISNTKVFFWLLLVVGLLCKEHDPSMI